MYFSFECRNIKFKGQIQYLINEQSFYYYPCNNTSFSIMIGQGYNSLDVDIESGHVLQLTGLNPMQNWISKELGMPTYKSGILTTLFNEKYPKGTGIQYTSEWNTYFDIKTGWVCIGNPDSIQHGIGIEFAANTVALFCYGQLSAVWIKPQFV